MSRQVVHIVMSSHKIFGWRQAVVLLVRRSLQRLWLLFFVACPVRWDRSSLRLTIDKHLLIYPRSCGSLRNIPLRRFLVKTRWAPTAGTWIPTSVMTHFILVFSFILNRILIGDCRLMAFWWHWYLFYKHGLCKRLVLIIANLKVIGVVHAVKKLPHFINHIAKVLPSQFHFLNAIHFR